MSLDIHSAVQVTIAIAAAAFFISIWRGIALVRKARTLPFFRMRRDMTVRGWRLLTLWGFVWLIIVFLLPTQIEPLIYSVYPPTATVTITPTITVTPTISQTPTITLTPSITPTPAVTDTPTITPTPFVPLAIELEFEGIVTPNPDARFSELTFTDGLDALYRPLNPGVIFQNPIDHMYAVFSYDGMIDGSQWTALWYRSGELVHYETKPWDGGTGGLGYTDWAPGAQEWQAGIYQVQIFVGVQIKVTGEFSVEGEPPTPEPSPTSTPSATATRTLTPTRTPLPSQTLPPSSTPRPTRTWTPVPSITPTRTPFISPTRTPTNTPWPTLTRTPVTPTITPQPTQTRTPTNTPIP
jgi:hypothetical protein